MEPESLGQVPGVTDEELRAALRDLGNIPAVPIDVIDRFGNEVRAIVEDRAQSGWHGEDASDVAVFLHAPYPRETGKRLSAMPVCNLIANGSPILGKVFVLNPDASSGSVIDLPVAADHILNWLEDRKLGGLPVLFAYRGSKRLLLRAKGAEGEITRKDIIRDHPPVATLQEVGDALALIHREMLVSPIGCPEGVWENGRAAAYVPGPRPEQAIQGALKTNLASWFRGIVRATVEESTPYGRIDVRLSHLRDGVWAYWAILELKVLRSNHNAPDGKRPKPVPETSNVEAVAEGVRQVHAFAKTWRAEPLLEIFDLRKTKAPDVLQAAAVKLELSKCAPVPACRIWQLFGSAGDARLAGYPN